MLPHTMSSACSHVRIADALRALFVAKAEWNADCVHRNSLFLAFTLLDFLVRHLFGVFGFF
jgi:hypothetical protein